jgi:hypothetical protein
MTEEVTERMDRERLRAAQWIKLEGILRTVASCGDFMPEAGRGWCLDPDGFRVLHRKGAADVQGGAS